MALSVGQLSRTLTALDARCRWSSFAHTLTLCAHFIELFLVVALVSATTISHRFLMIRTGDRQKLFRSI